MGQLENRSSRVRNRRADAKTARDAQQNAFRPSVHRAARATNRSAIAADASAQRHVLIASAGLRTGVLWQLAALRIRRHAAAKAAAGGRGHRLRPDNHLSDRAAAARI